MSTRLVVIAGPDKGAVFPLVKGQRLVIGRGETAQIRLNDNTVSRIHCWIEFGDETIVGDAGSRSGTRVNGNAISEKTLQANDVIALAATQLRFEPELRRGKAPPLPAARLGELTGTLLGHFDIGAIVGEGDSGIVFQAQDTKEDRLIALKVFWPGFSEKDEDFQRFIRAVKTMLPLRHPNLVTLFGGGKTGPYCWMAMEFVEGESLTQMIGRIGKQGKLDWRPALRVALSACRALHYLHGHQIIHRNLSPENILYNRTHALAKLGSLILAKALAGEFAQDVTSTGHVLGAVPYLSPEQVGADGDVDGRSDIYSLGAVVYALLTGKPPCLGRSDVETIRAICTRAPARPQDIDPTIPDALQHVVLTALAKDQRERYQTASELLADLEQLPKV